MLFMGLVLLILSFVYSGSFARLGPAKDDQFMICNSNRKIYLISDIKQTDPKYYQF